MHDPVDEALDRATVALESLHRRCCEPDRSPRMAELSSQLEVIRRAAAEPGGPDGEAIAASAEAAGSIVGALQIGCCAPDRLPLYADLLRELNTVVRHVAPMH